VHVLLLPLAGVAGRGLLHALGVRRHDLVDDRDQLVRVRHLAGRRPGRDAADEEGLGHVERADAGEVALVQQRLADRAAGDGEQPPPRLGGVPGLAEDVGPEVADERVLAVGAHQVEHPELVPDRRPLGVGQDRPDPAVPARPPAGPVHPPLALHAEVAVQGETAGHPGEQVLPGARDVEDLPAAQVHGGERRPAQVAGDELAPGQGGVQPPGRPPDHVAFGHAPTLPPPG
jgi:hypothetical protein